MAFDFKDLLPILGGIAGGMIAGPVGAGVGSSLGKATDKEASLAEILGAGALSYGGANILGAGANAAEPAAVGKLAETAGADMLAGAAPAGGLDAVAASPMDALKGAGQYAMTKEGLLHGVAPMAGGAALSGMFDQPVTPLEMPAEGSTGQKYFAKPLNRTYTPQTPSQTGREQSYFSYFAEGGPVSGPTGGMDDLVDTSIEGKVPAKLSHGEFVVPADVVSALGDGNTEAGTNKLYALLKAIREEKYGSPEQPPKLKMGLADLMHKSMKDAQ